VIVQRCILRSQRNLKDRVIRRWTIYVTERQEAIEQSFKASKFWQKITLSKAFNTFKYEAGKRKRLRHRIQVLIHQKIYKSKQEAFKMIERYTMSGAFADRLELIEKINSSAQQNQLARTYAKRTIRHALRRKLFVGFNTWMLHCKWHRKADMNKIIKRWKLLELNTVFQTYKIKCEKYINTKSIV